MDETTLQHAIELSKRGDKAEARRLLEEIVAEESANLTAWFWLADSAETLAERVSILHQARQYHPDDIPLTRALRKFEADLAAEQQFFQEIETLRPQQQEQMADAESPVIGDLLNQYLQEQEDSLPPLEAEVLSQPYAAEPPDRHIEPSAREDVPIPKARRKSQPFWFALVLVLSAFLLFLVGAVWQLLGPNIGASNITNMPAATSTFTPDSESMVENAPGDTAMAEPSATLATEATATPTSPPVDAGEVTATPIIAATITPTPAVAEGLFIPLDGTQFTDMKWSSDGTWFAVSSWAGVSIFDGRNFQSHQVITTDPIQPVGVFAFSEDERFLAAGFINQQSGEDFLTRAKMWNINDGAEIASFDYSQPRGVIDNLAFSLDGETLWANAAYDEVIKWRVSDQALLDVYQQSSSAVDYFDVSFAPDRRSFVTFSLYDRVRQYDAATGESVAILGAEKNGTGAVYSPNSQYLAVSYQDSGEVRVWDLPGRQEYRLLNTHSNGVLGMAFNPFSRVLAVITADGLIQMYDIHSGEELRVISRHTPGAVQLAFSPDDTMLAVRSAKEVQVWNLQTDRLLATFRITD
ncbi:MAG: hypothetical protein HPY85_14585 [Anaerolineae bacterium]|nr:hypothetical protein [Anaerolineae bacterium]